MKRIWPATMMVALFIVLQISAQTADDKPKPSRLDVAKELTVAKVEAALAAVEAASDIAPEVKTLLRPKYKEAIATLKEAADLEAKAAEYRKALQEAPQQTAEFRTQLKLLPSVDEAANVKPRGGVDDIQKNIEMRRSALDTLQNKLAKITKELSRVKGRPTEISVRLPSVQVEIADVRKKLEAPEFAKEAASNGVIADRLLLQAREKKLQSELEMLQQEQRSQAAREALLQSHKNLLARQEENATAALESLNSILYPRLTSDAKRISRQARNAKDGLPDGDADAQAMAAEVLTLSREYQSVVEKLKISSIAQNDMAERLDILTNDFERLQEQLKAGASGREMVKVLLDLERTAASARSASMWESLPSPEDTRLAALKIDEKLRMHSDLQKRLDVQSSESLAMLLSLRRETLEKLQTQYAKLNRTISDYESDKQQYLNKSGEIRNFLLDQLFWMRSSPPIGLDTFTDIPDGLRWALSYDHWLELITALPEIAVSRPILTALVLLVSCGLLVRRRRIRTALKESGLKIRRISTDRYKYTMQAVLWTFLLAVPLPLLLGYLGWALQHTPNAGNWLRGIALGMRVVTGILFTAAFVSAVCRPSGLGPAHFSARPETLLFLRRALRRFIVVYIPSILLMTSFIFGDGLRYLDSVGRISFILAHGWAALVLWRLFHHASGITSIMTRENPNHLMTRLRFIWVPLALASPLFLIILAGAGYLITAVQLSFSFLMTMTIIGMGVLIYCLMLRWFMIKERKLALAEAIEKRRARLDAGSENEQDEADKGETDESEEDGLDLDTIGVQTRGLLQLVVVWSVAVAIFLFWSKAVPLTEAIDDIRLPFAGNLTLLSLLQAILIASATILAVRNLPGLLELAVLRATNFQAGTRNAIATLCQYSLITLSIILLFSVLRIDWAQFGWIAAGLSVGIGFGMQEVVANFVCGIILLFEQPIRVGDIVTIEGITGRVSKINLRATKITNWDNQDFVVPNKTLITGTILNWTLSESVNRIVIPVGVAYGSDTEKARKILLEAAAHCPHVLKEPAPIASFEQFADSSLNLVLRAYLPNIDVRLEAITELHTEIDKRFAEASIHIPFPQRDLHIVNGNGTGFETQSGSVYSTKDE